jgi:type I restriction enzyme M protein
MMSTEANTIKQVVDFLRLKYGFPTSHIRIGPKIRHNNEVIIPDIIVFGVKNDVEFPLLIVEVKQPIRLFSPEQLVRYMKTLGLRYGILSDGVNYVFYYQISPQQFVEIPYIPSESHREVLFRKDLLNIPINLSYKFEKIIWIIADHFRSVYSRQTGAYVDIFKIFSSFQKMLLCKIIDERDTDSELLFNFGTLSITDNEKLLDKKEVFKRVSTLFDRVKDTYPNVFGNEYELGLGLDESVIFKIVLELQSYSITRTDNQTVREAYEHAIQMLIDKWSLVKKNSGEVAYTPKPITDFVVRLLQPNISQKILDPAVGFGSFLSSCLSYIEKHGKNSTLSDFDRYAQTNLYGIEKRSQVASFTKVTMIINKGDHNHIILADPLVKKPLLGEFDYVLTNPPFGAIFAMEYNGTSTEFPFIELGLNFLKSYGKMAIILPESFMFSNKSAKVRDYLLRNGLLDAIISLPAGVFPESKIRSNVIILTKSSDRAESSNYKVFMAEIADALHVRTHDSKHFDTIISKYDAFLQGKGIEPSRDPTVFSIDASRLRDMIWSVSYHIPQPKHVESKYAKSKLGDLLVGVTRGIATLASKYSEKPEHNRVPFIRISDMVKGRINNVKIMYVNPEEIPQADKYRVKEDNILISIKTTLGKVALVTKEFDNSIISPQIANLKIKKDVLEPNYLCYVLSSAYIKRQIERRATYYVGGLSQISIRGLKEIDVPLPPLDQQRKIVERIMIEEQKYRKSTDYAMPERINDILSEA